MKRRTRGSPMTGAQFKALRESLDLGYAELASLADCTEQTIRNIEQKSLADKHPSRQMVVILMALRDMRGRAVLEALRQERYRTLKQAW